MQLLLLHQSQRVDLNSRLAKVRKTWTHTVSTRSSATSRVDEDLIKRDVQLTGEGVVFDEQLVSGEQKGFTLHHPLYLVKCGIEAIIEDSVTKRFSAAELRVWNFLGRNQNYVYMKTDKLAVLNLLWFIGFFVRYGLLFPCKVFTFSVSIPLTWIVGYLARNFPVAPIRQWLHENGLQKAIRLNLRPFSSVIRFHDVHNRPRPNTICVANHTTPFDWCVLASDVTYAVVGQKHSGFFGLAEKIISAAVPAVWFDRDEVLDRQRTAARLKEHVMSPNAEPLLIFPEGTCINNTSVMKFKKGCFEVGAPIHPVAIKYNPLFADCFWNSSRDSLLQYTFKIMSSWAMVVDVWYLPPTRMRDDEDGIMFAGRVQQSIANCGGLLNMDCAIQPRLYELREIHKAGVLIRPVLDDIGSPLHELARFLTEFQCHGSMEIRLGDNSELSVFGSFIKHTKLAHTVPLKVTRSCSELRSDNVKVAQIGTTREPNGNEQYSYCGAAFRVATRNFYSLDELRVKINVKYPHSFLGPKIPGGDDSTCQWKQAAGLYPFTTGQLELPERQTENVFSTELAENVEEGLGSADGSSRHSGASDLSTRTHNGAAIHNLFGKTSSVLATDVPPNIAKYFVTAELTSSAYPTAVPGFEPRSSDVECERVTSTPPTHLNFHVRRGERVHASATAMRSEKDKVNDEVENTVGVSLEKGNAAKLTAVNRASVCIVVDRRSDSALKPVAEGATTVRLKLFIFHIRWSILLRFVFDYFQPFNDPYNFEAHKQGGRHEICAKSNPPKRRSRF
ncbi:glycerol-3-phosphate acyltransferase 3 [Clonorchis sinensis]|uniref:Glycerol-3-phosphate acyltransferase 3 n=1 Tax=Clonorchis sinensis TaxID=79923 RepID=G7YJB8_CLOSI|nr:glycerol-3-phosphate acyltransferase 3 [Clonorchis sinensis]